MFRDESCDTRADQASGGLPRCRSDSIKGLGSAIARQVIVRSVLRVREVDEEHNDMPGTSAGSAIGAVGIPGAASDTVAATVAVIGNGYGKVDRPPEAG